MAQRSIPAAFMRGGTSKGLMLRADDLPADREAWASLFTAMMGSPDDYGRQLDGMGGGVSSLSKVCVVAPSARSDADIDYTFAQVSIRVASVDYAGNCGNMSSAVGPFAVDEGWTSGSEAEGAVVRIFNTNTGKRIDARFPVEAGRARYDGDLVIPGVSGSGAAIRLDFIQPGGATTGRLLPTGRPRDILVGSSFGAVEVSMVDAANAAVFVRATDLGLDGRETPEEIDGRADLLARLEGIRAAASVAMGIAPDEAAARTIRMVPFVCLVAPPRDDRSDARQVADLVLRAMSNGQAHRALPLTVSLCVAVAAQIQGSVVAECRRASGVGGALKLAMPSGTLAVDAEVEQTDEGWTVARGSFFRTARRLFDGRIWVPGATTPGA